jgi:hypothetical protein
LALERLLQQFEGFRLSKGRVRPVWRAGMSGKIAVGNQLNMVSVQYFTGRR